MKKYFFTDEANTWWAEYWVDGMANSDNQTVQAIKSKVGLNPVNWTDLDGSIVVLGLPDKVGTRFNHADWLQMATDKKVRMFMTNEQDSQSQLRKSTSKEILSYLFPDSVMVGDATIDSTNGTVGVNVKYATTLTALVAQFSLSVFNQGAKIGSTAQVSGSTANNFSTPKTYVVKDEAGSTKNWVVTVTKFSNASLITGFDLAAKTGAATINDGAGTIAIEVANGTDVTELAPTITVSTGATISPISATAQDFTAPVVYTVTSQDGTVTKEYTVTVTVAAA